MATEVVSRGMVFVQSSYLQKEGMSTICKKNKVQITNRKRDRRHLLQQSSRQFNSHHDPLWHQTPEMGLEALVATLDSEEELQKALKKEVIIGRREKRMEKTTFNGVN